MKLTLSLTRRTAVLGAATLLALGGAVVVGLSGDSAVPKALAGTYPAGDSAALASDAFPGVTVEGVGKVTGTPDTLILNLSVSKTAGDVSAAIGQVSGTMKAVQDSLAANKVAAADMRTSGLDVGPRFDYSNGKQSLNGYTATESLSVTLRDTKSAGAAISAAVAAGGDATQVNGLSTDLQNNSALLNAARDAAFADAKLKAAQYAKSAGRTLGAVVRVQESVSPAPSPLAYDNAKGAASVQAPAVPIQMGSTDLSVQVTVVFAFA